MKLEDGMALVWYAPGHRDACGLAEAVAPGLIGSASRASPEPARRACCVIAAIVSSPGGAVGNLALAAIQTALALAR